MAWQNQFEVEAIAISIFVPAVLGTAKQCLLGTMLGTAKHTSGERCAGLLETGLGSQSGELFQTAGDTVSAVLSTESHGSRYQAREDRVRSRSRYGGFTNKIVWKASSAGVAIIHIPEQLALKFLPIPWLSVDPADCQVVRFGSPTWTGVLDDCPFWPIGRVNSASVAGHSCCWAVVWKQQLRT